MPSTSYTEASSSNRDADILTEEIASVLDIKFPEINLSISFIQNGGDSLSAIKVVSLCRARCVFITVAMLMSYATLADVICGASELSRKDERSVTKAVSRMSEQESHAKCHGPEATDLQLAMIHGTQTLEHRNIIRYFETYSTDDIPKVKSAWQAIISTEPIFRTRFEPHEHTYHLNEANIAPFVWEETTVTNRERYSSALGEWHTGAELVRLGFQVVHLQVNEKAEKSTVIWNIHHALIDGYSSVLLFNKHRNILSGGSTSPGPSFVGILGKISDYRRSQETLATEFWKEQESQLSLSKSELLLPKTELPAKAFYARTDVELEVSHEDILRYARRNGVTVASVFCAAWGLTLSKYVDSTHVHFGVVLSGRTIPIPESEDVIGPMINTVPFQVPLDQFQLSSSYLKHVFQYAIELSKFQWSMPRQHSFKKYPSTLNIHFETPLLQRNPLRLLQKPEASVFSELPLRINIHTDGVTQLHYHESQFSEADVRRLGRTFARAVSSLLEPGLSIAQCRDYLILDDLEELHTYGNLGSLATTPGYYAGYGTLIDLFNKSALQHPRLVAVEKGTTTITYANLRVLVFRVAQIISNYAVPGDVICVDADRSVNWIIAIYAVLSAGCVYCPLDAGIPEDARNQNFSQSGSRMFISSSNSTKGSYRPQGCERLLSVADVLNREDNALNVPGKKRRRTDPSSDPDAGAYLCFTSGSSGLPKGVQCSQRSLVAFQKDFDVRLKSAPGWRIGQTMSAAFDGSIHEIFSALSYGATLVLRSSDDPFEHLSRVDAAILVPSVARVLHPDDFPSLKTLYLVGEAVPQIVCDTWAARMTTYNMYGPTEATCGATIKELKPGKPVTLGRPNPSTRLYILDNQRKFAPIGVIGEIYLAGVQVAQGYNNMPLQTTHRFLPDSISHSDSGRMYRTGDRGYWNEEGELCFCGRIDRQIKLQGFRIDLDDVEVRIQRAILGCTGVAVTQAHGEYIIAQIQPQTLRLTEVKQSLVRNLPGYMVPRHIAIVSEFPRTKTGKLDHEAMIQSVSRDSTDTTSATTLSPVLFEKVASIWRDVLGLPTIKLHRDSNFLQLGGNSLLQLQLANRLTNVLGHPVAHAFVIRSHSLGDLVETLQDQSVVDNTRHQSDSGWSSISSSEYIWYSKYQFKGGSSSFNVSICFELPTDVKLFRLRDAWNSVLAHHAVFRSRFTAISRHTAHRTFANKPPQVQMMDYVDLSSEINKNFDIGCDNLIRIMIAPARLVLVASHIICDYTSLNTTLREVAREYNDGKVGTETSVDMHLRRAIKPATHDTDFWRGNLEGQKNLDYSIGRWTHRSSYDGTSFLSKVPVQIFSRLRQFTRSRHITSHQVALTAVSMALQYHRESIDITLGVPHLGRRDSLEEEALGLFLEPLPVRIRFPDDSSSSSANVARELPEVVQTASQNALGHAIEWSKLVQIMGATAEGPDWPLFDVMVSYHESFKDICMTGIEAKPLCTWTEGSKFKLMVEFIVTNEHCLLVRLEYSHECFDEREIRIMAKLVVTALSMVIEGQSVDDMRKLLLQVSEERDADCMDLKSHIFGMRLDSL